MAQQENKLRGRSHVRRHTAEYKCYYRTFKSYVLPLCTFDTSEAKNAILRLGLLPTTTMLSVHPFEVVISARSKALLVVFLVCFFANYVAVTWLWQINAVQSSHRSLLYSPEMLRAPHSSALAGCKRHSCCSPRMRGGRQHRTDNRRHLAVQLTSHMPTSHQFNALPNSEKKAIDQQDSSVAAAADATDASSSNSSGRVALLAGLVAVAALVLVASGGFGGLKDKVKVSVVALCRQLWLQRLQSRV